MKIPKSVIITTTNVHRDEQNEILNHIDDYKFSRTQVLKDNESYIIVGTEKHSLIDVIRLYEVLESNCWEWKEEHKLGAFKEPIWIGIDIDSNFGPNYKYCLGINMEDGTELSVLDYKNPKADWFIPSHRISVKYGVDKRVFDDKNNLNL